jgi:chromosome segregation ATPase
MPRTSVTLTESAMNQVDSKAKEEGLTRSDYIAKAVDSALEGTLPELHQIESDLNQKESYLNQVKAELNQAQLEVMQSRRNTSKLENQLAEKDKTIEAVRREMNQANQRLNQVESELNQAKIEVAKLESATKSKEDEIVFLRGHVAQLTQSISRLTLPPSEEEAKKKGWWQFWK